MTRNLPIMKSVSSFSKSLARAKGATLIEVLVAIFLLAIGLLAMAALTASATGYNKISQIKGVATMMVNDYAEQAKANLRAFDALGYDLKEEQGTTRSCTLPTAASATAAGFNEGKCVAEFDRFNWQEQLKVRLPSGGAYVESTPPAKDLNGVRTMDIWVRWKEQELATNMISEKTKCPAKATPTDDPDYKCLYFKVAL